jgi:hypothetical protein
MPHTHLYSTLSQIFITLAAAYTAYTAYAAPLYCYDGENEEELSYYWRQAA